MAAPTEQENRDLFDAQIRHQIFLILLAQGLAVRLIDILNGTEEQVAAKIRSAFRGKAKLETVADVKRVNELLRQIAKARGRAWSEVQDEMLSEILDATKEEPKTLKALLLLAGLSGIAIPPNATARNIVRQRPFMGRTLREWLDKLQADELARIKAQVRMGAVARESGDEIAVRVVGTARARGSDGATETTRRQVTTIATTGVLGAADEMAREFAQDNSGLTNLQELYVAVLDNRTTPICRSLDGKRFAIGVGPHPPLHPNCRSRRVLIFKHAPDPRPQSYVEWLRRQSAEFQNEILGKARGALFRNNALDLDQFVTPRGRTITLEELATRNARAFRKAGLDPKEFR